MITTTSFYFISTHRETEKLVNIVHYCLGVWIQGQGTGGQEFHPGEWPGREQWDGDWGHRVPGRPHGTPHGLACSHFHDR